MMVNKENDFSTSWSEFKFIVFLNAPILIHVVVNLWMAFSNALDLAKLAFSQKRSKEYTAKCNLFTVHVST